MEQGARRSRRRPCRISNRVDGGACQRHPPDKSAAAQRGPLTRYELFVHFGFLHATTAQLDPICKPLAVSGRT